MKMYKRDTDSDTPIQQAPGFIIQSVPTQPLLVGPDNTIATCPFCSASIKTAIKYSVTSRTHLFAVLCCNICCCCIPYMMTSCKNTDHYCPNCHRYLGTYKR